MNTLSATERPLVQCFDAALVDLDGVTYRGPEPIPTAPPALQAAADAGMALVYVTNNASRTPGDVAQHLIDVGIPARGDDVMTAAGAAATLLAERLDSGARVLVVGGRGLRIAVEAAGLTIVDSATDDPEAVVQGWSPDLGWKHLAEAAYAVHAGAWFLATNLDKTLPNERGFAPGNGSLVRAVATAAEVEPDSAGKPEPAMFHLAARKVGADTPLVIGDRLDTDLAGAVAAGYAGLMVLTGVNTAVDAMLAPPEYRPTFLGQTLESLHEAHPAATLGDGWWQVGESRARIRDGRVEFDGAVGIDRARAGCAAVWSREDEGDQPLVDAESIFGLG